MVGVGQRLAREILVVGSWFVRWLVRWVVVVHRLARKKNGRRDTICLTFDVDVSNSCRG